MKLLAICTLLLLGWLIFKPSNPHTYTFYSKLYNRQVTVESKAKVIALVLNKELALNKDGETYCLNKVLFYSLHTGYVICNTLAMTDVYRVYSNGWDKREVYFTEEDLNFLRR